MRQPSIEDVAVLRGRSSEWFRRWLRVGLGEYLIERKGRTSFEGVEPFVDQREGSIASDLQQLALTLPLRDLEAFRQAVSDLVQELNFSNSADAVIAEALLELGAGIAARGLLAALAAKSFTMSPDHESAKLYDLAFDLATQAPDTEPAHVTACLRHLVRHDGLFHPNLSGRALLAMTQALPDEFPSHFDFLAAPLDESYGYVLNNRNEEVLRERKRRRLVEKLQRVLIQPRLLAHACRPDAGYRPEVSNWWLNTIARHFPLLVFELSAHPPAGDLLGMEEVADVSISSAEQRSAFFLEEMPSATEAEANFFDLGGLSPSIPTDEVEDFELADTGHW